MLKLLDYIGSRNKFTNSDFMSFSFFTLAHSLTFSVNSDEKTLFALDSKNNKTHHGPVQSSNPNLDLKTGQDHDGFYYFYYQVQIKFSHLN